MSEAVKKPLDAKDEAKINAMKEELMKVAQGAKSPEDILAFAKGKGLPLAEEKVKELFDRVHSISDDQLDAVAGGLSMKDLQADLETFQYDLICWATGR